MAGGGDNATVSRGVAAATHTTSAEDQAEVAKLQARIAQSNAASGDAASKHAAGGFPLAGGASGEWEIPSVQIAEGAHKYVLVSAIEPAPRAAGAACLRQDFVVSRHGAEYHRNAAEPLVYLLEKHGYTDIRVKGGGRILLDSKKKKIFIFGYSYGFGAADHAKSKEVVDADDRYKGYDVTWSADGY